MCLHAVDCVGHTLVGLEHAAVGYPGYAIHFSSVGDREASSDEESRIRSCTFVMTRREGKGTFQAHTSQGMLVCCCSFCRTEALVEGRRLLIVNLEKNREEPGSAEFFARIT